MAGFRSNGGMRRSPPSAAGVRRERLQVAFVAIVLGALSEGVALDHAIEVEAIEARGSGMATVPDAGLDQAAHVLEVVRMVDGPAQRGAIGRRREPAHARAGPALAQERRDMLALRAQPRVVPGGLERGAG